MISNFLNSYIFLYSEIYIGNMQVPKGINVWLIVTILRTDPTIWGLHALKFRPQRFENGITGACRSPNWYIPFEFAP